MTPTTVLPLPEVPADVAAHVAAHGETHLLDRMRLAARDVFPNQPIQIELYPDWEIPDTWYVIFRIFVPGWSVDEMVAGNRRLSLERANLIPGDSVVSFCINLEPGE